MRAAGLVLLACVSCTTFTAPAEGDASAVPADAGASDADGGASCPAESCTGKTECNFYDFEGGCPPWITSGDGELHECSNGKLRIRATSTLDSVGGLNLPTPKTAYSVRIAARIAVTDWDGGGVFRVYVGSELRAQIKASKTIGTSVKYGFCGTDSDCGPQQLSFEAGSEHLFVIEMNATETKLTVDCTPAGVAAPGSLAQDDTLTIAFGKTDGDPIDGTLDDVLIQYQ